MPDLPGWDSLEAVTRYHRLAEIIGIIVLALLVVSEFISYRYGQRKDDLTNQQQDATEERHDEEMARLHLETAKANERAATLERDAAEVRERATQLELRLQFLRKQVGGRVIDREAFLSQLKGSKPPERVFIIVAQTADDGWYLGAQLSDLFKEINWPHDPPKTIPTESLYSTSSPMVDVGVIGSGMIVWHAPNPPDFGRPDWAWVALNGAIFRSLGTTGGGSGSDPTLTVTQLKVVIFPRR